MARQLGLGKRPLGIAPATKIRMGESVLREPRRRRYFHRWPLVAAGVAFVPPPPGLRLSLEMALPGVVAGPPPMGPEGIFVPPPPGSRFGIIIPAPLGTAPAVVTSVPPVVAVGMRVKVNNNNTNNTTINNRTTNTTNITNVTNVTNVTIEAPASATATGRPVNATVPAQAHLAAALAPVVKAQAPTPASSKPVPAFVHGRAPPSLPPAQPVKVETAAALHRRKHARQLPNRARRLRLMLPFRPRSLKLRHRQLPHIRNRAPRSPSLLRLPKSRNPWRLLKSQSLWPRKSRSRPRSRKTQARSPAKPASTAKAAAKASTAEETAKGKPASKPKPDHPKKPGDKDTKPDQD